MGGGGGGFGGGGFFNIPPEQIEPQTKEAEKVNAPKLDNQTIQKLKKKRTS
jgi:hypothetical protein